MNLRIADSAGLVAFLHRVIAETGSIVLTTPRMAVVRVNDVLFFHAKDPVSVGGPFASLEILVRSEGMRRHLVGGRASEVSEPVEVFEWAEAFFRIGGSRVEPVLQFDSLREALDDRGGLQ